MKRSIHVLNDMNILSFVSFGYGMVKIKSSPYPDEVLFYARDIDGIIKVLSDIKRAANYEASIKKKDFDNNRKYETDEVEKIIKEYNRIIKLFPFLKKSLRRLRDEL